MNLRDFRVAQLLSGWFGHSTTGDGAKTRLVIRGLIGAVALASLPAFAATTTINTLLDTDNNSASGCTVPTLNGPVQGVESIVTTTVIADTTGYRTQSISMQNCLGSSFGAPAFITNVPSPIARGNGAAGSTAVESYVPHPFLPATGQPMRVAITVAGSDGLTGGDALTQTAAGGPILVAGAPLVVVPTLTKLSLALTALLLAGALWYARRRGWTGMQLVVVAVFALSLSGQIIAAIVRDGLVADWTGVAPAAIDPAGDAPSGSDITNFYSVSEAGAVFFRYDIALNAPPVANAQSVVAVANVALPITLSGTDYEASPLTYTVLTQPTHGTLTGTPPNLTYTANSAYGGPDSFTFRVNDGVLDSATATVTIDVKLPPTITSVNTATFIPGQANSFNFTATAIPSATFALSACNVALPPSITVTNNANNTATLAGNPTVAQGGTYICTLTASNGFGTNATQTFTLNLGLPPTFTSAANTTFTVGTAGTFAVTTTATPATTGITQAGALPTGVTFVYNGPGTPLTGTLAGTPAAGTGGVYPFTLTAANGIPPNTVQNFTLTVNQAPVITSAAATACTVGLACTFTVTTSGFPAPTIAAGGVALPGGMTFVDNANGTGTLSGTPNTGTVGGSPYAITFTATNVAGSTAPQAFALTINKANTTTAISNAAALASTPTVVGEPYAVNVTVTPVGTGTPTGTVTVSDGAATCTITLPAASCNLVSTTVGAPKTITAVYNGDASFNTSSAPGGTTHTVNKAATTTTIANAAALAAATVVGQAYPVTWTVTVNAPGAVGVALTGNVTVSDGSASCTAAIAAGTCSLTSTTAGAKSLTATYAGDANYLTSTSAPATPHTVNPAATTTTISNAAALGTATVVGQAYSVTWTVTVNAPGALGAALTGNVTVSDGSATCTAAVAAGTCNVTSTTAGAKSLTATYAGDANYLTSASAPVAHTVNPAATTTTITNAAALGTATVIGQAYPVTWSVTVNAPGTLGAPLTGNVTVSDGSATCIAAVAAGTCNLASTSAGGKTLTASYAGDANYGTSTSVGVPHTVSPPATTTTISNAAALGTATVVGQAYPVTWTVTVNAPGVLGAPLSGNVTVSDGSATCVAAVAAGICNLTSTTAGAKSITASYAGDANYNGSTSTPATPHTVSPAATTTTISNAAALVATTVVGQAYPVTWTVTVNAPGAVGVALTGNVTVSDGSASCTAAIAAGTCSLTSTTAGAKSLTATYAGDANYLTSTSAPATPHTVNPAATTTTISNAAALGTATVVGQAYPVTWTVTVNAPGALGAALTGNVTVSDGSATCTAAVAAGTCNVTSTTAGAKSLTATYAGDANYLTSASAPATPHTVGLPNTTTTITNAATLSSTPSLVSAAYAVNWSVTVNAPGTLGAPLTGNVTVSDGSANCVAPVAAGTCNLTSTTSGAKLLTATYAGDSNYNGSASSPATPHDVNQAPTIAVNVNNPFTIGVAGSLITFTVTGFPAPTLALSGCALPPGLSLTGTQISGTATAGAVTVSGCVVTATNVAGSAPTTPAFTITVNQAPSITSVGPAIFTVGTNSSYSINATGTPGISNITLTGCALPTGLAFSYVSGNSATISGNATVGGSVTCLVTAINGIAPNATQSLTVTANQAPTISAISNSTFTVGTPGSGSFTVTGVPVPTLALSGCTLPANLTLTGTQISGTAALGATSVSGCIVTASNGIGSPAATAPFAITVIAPPPTVTASGNPAATFTEDGPAVVIDSGMTAASIGTTTLVGATASITGNFQAGQDVLAFATIGPISGSYVAGTGVLTLTGADTVANYQAALRTITYSNSSQTPNVTARTVSFVVSHSTASSAAATRTVNVVAVNDAPVVTASVGATSFTEPAGAGAIGVASAVVVDSGLTVADVDSANLTGATIIIGAGLVTSEDSLLFTNTASITGSYAAASGTLTLTGTDTLANYQAALRSVRYLNSSHDPNPSPRTVSFQVNDGGAVNNLSNVATKTVSITATNTPPTATGFVGLPAQAGIPITYPAGKLFGTDAEAGTTVTVATTPDSNCAGCLLTINADGSFTFTPPPSAAGTTVSFTYHVTDNGSPGAGLSSVPATVAFSVAGPAIYFVKSAAVGVGNCTLGNECTLTTAVTNIGASTSAHIFISDANTHTHAAIVHNGDNRVIGQGVVVASFDALFAIAAPAQGTLAARPAVNGTKPRVNTTITAHNNTHVRGLNLTPTAGANKGVTATGRTGLLFTDLTIDMTASGATGNAIDLTSSSADFTGGGLVITGTSGRGFHATGAGTITVQGAGNKVTTTTGRAIHVDTTTIGASGMTFEAVSANGTDSGIFLNATGASAGLTVTGTAAANSGGTIQNTSSHGISLATTTSPSFNRMNIQSTGGSGVNGTAVTHFSFTNGTINNSGNAVLHSNIAFNANEAANNNLSGVVTVTGNTLTNAFDSGVDIRGALGTISNATVTGNTITSSTNAATSKGQGINFVGLGTAGGTHSVTKATISNNIITNFPSGAGIQVSGGNASSAGSPQATFGIPGDPTNIISITGNQIKGASIAIPMNTSAIIYAISGVARGNADISGNGTVANPLTNMVGTAILVGFNGNATGTVTTTNNVIVANNSLGSQGIGGGGGITFGVTDTPNMTWTIANNNISATDGNGILAVVRGVNGTGRFKIQNNTVAAPLGGVRPGIRVDAGNANGNATVCLNISGNTSAGNVGFPQGIGLRRQTTNTNAFGVNGMAATATPGVEAYVDGLNPAGNGTLLISGTTGFSNCSFP